MQGRVGGKTGSSRNDGDEMLILVDNRRNDRQPMLLLKQADGTTKAVRMQRTVGGVCKGCTRNAMLRASKAIASRAQWAKPHVRDGLKV